MDPMQRQPTTPLTGGLFDTNWKSTSTLAGEAAAMSNHRRWIQILELLLERSRTCWEVAEVLGVAVHTISGRFGSELGRDMLIVRTGERRTQPGARTPSDVWAITEAGRTWLNDNHSKAA